MIKISKGLDIPLSGRPEQKIHSGPTVKSVAVLGDDFNGMKPTMFVQVGDKVAKGQPLFEDKKTPGVLFTSPVSGTVKEINRGDKRVFQSVVIDVSGSDKQSFKSFTPKGPDAVSESEVRQLLIESGEWTSLRTRPFSRTPMIDSKPSSIFVTAIDTNPLAANPEAIIAERMDDFKAGVTALSKLAPKIFVVTAPQSKIDVKGIANVRHEEFKGPHPAGNVGTHIHFLDPVSPTKTVWHLGYQDVIAIGYLFRTGELLSEKVVSVAGPMAKIPRLVKVLRGASLADVTRDEIRGGPDSEVRIVSGSVLGGRAASGVGFYLGHFHHQISLIKEGRHREFLGWNKPGFDKYSLKRVFLSRLLPKRDFPFDTNTNGSVRSIVPIGSFEAVMPMDILPTQLLRYLMAKSTDMAVNLGALELDEEDLSLCTFVDPCKNEYGPVLRQNLDIIQKEGV